MSALDIRLSRTPTQARARDKVVRALDAAERLLDRDGEAALSLTAVCEEAGLNVGTVYQYLPDRDAIIAALIDRFSAELERAVQAMVDTVGSRPLDDGVDRAVALLAVVYRSAAGRRALQLLPRPSDPAVAAHRERMVAHVHAVLAETGHLGHDAVGLRHARAVYVACEALVREAFTRESDGDESLLQAARVMMRSYLAQIPD
ncbi:TetR/AcrR family transcriptional regulator [Microbacterium sp. SORGH_AS_0862]|uniref:TetR/AcrR family transcriptional regulator n=1 Tax=Microbacterium sp. SORGH_AS_0862 TaxID=3041789 RepID=UPI0027944396|nr:TetR/AcrR family transcriptional regulator [Microbacterium sp. SORGH_AS_0862]MDQ1206298.1 AcrR family transcriptional regulator [Microbacterium sp. SORGH_AS_0862]